MSIGKIRMSIKSFIDKVNKALAVKITLAIGTMWCVYVFSLLVAIPLVLPQTTTAIMFISSSFLQLVLLPCLLVGQQVLGEASDRQRAEDHAAIQDALSHIHELIKTEQDEDTTLTELRKVLSNQQTILEELQRRSTSWR
jgi:hypothetical protein